jgi:hypothetical protein
MAIYLVEKLRPHEMFLPVLWQSPLLHLSALPHPRHIGNGIPAEPLSRLMNSPKSRRAVPSFSKGCVDCRHFHFWVGTSLHTRLVVSAPFLHLLLFNLTHITKWQGKSCVMASLGPWQQQYEIHNSTWCATVTRTCYIVAAILDLPYPTCRISIAIAEPYLGT